MLIVDDHAGFRERARVMLESEGFDVVAVAESGARALELAAETEFDVVLLDVQLPDFTGFDVARRLTAEHNASAVVLTSSRDGDDFEGLIAASGARGFLRKGALTGPALAALLT